MDKYFLLVEVLSYAFALFLFIKKRELSIIYLPVLIFSNNIIEPRFSASIYYATISLLIIGSLLRNVKFYKNNFFAVLLFLYFLLLLTRSEDLVAIRPNVFSVLWFFISIPLIVALYKKYPADVVFKELTTSAFIILVLFISNVLLSTFYHYSPTRMYGISGGILYGNVYAAGFNILSIAIFIVALKLIMEKKILFLVVAILAYTFILLSLRRSVMVVSTLGIALALMTLLFRKETKKFIILGSLIVISGFFIYSKTNFESEFKKRYELRQLDDRHLENEARFSEYDLIYKDMFVYKAYSPWIGYQLFNSAGNYGKRIFEFRSLHGDVPAIVHSSGAIGLLLYFFTLVLAFKKSISAASSAINKCIVFFSLLALLVFTATGRFTESGSMLLIFLLLTYPLAQESTPADDPDSNEPSYPITANDNRDN